MKQTHQKPSNESSERFTAEKQLHEKISSEPSEKPAAGNQSLEKPLREASENFTVEKQLPQKPSSESSGNLIVEGRQQQEPSTITDEKLTEVKRSPKHPSTYSHDSGYHGSQDATATTTTANANPETVADDEDDWIKPLNDAEDEMNCDMRAPELIAHEERMKSASTGTLASPGKADMAPSPPHISVSNPTFSTRTSPQSSPNRLLASPFKASRARLQAMMKNARTLFATSASASAAAKAEAFTRTPPTAATKVSNLTVLPSANALEDEGIPMPPPSPEAPTAKSLDDPVGPLSVAVETADHNVPPPCHKKNSRRAPIVAKPKTQPVSIRVGTMSQRIVTQPMKPSQPAKPKALLVAERKKEQDECETQRRLEQKRELERKRVAQQEETKRQEQRQRAEAERADRDRVATEQAKRTAQQQAIERKRVENAKKMEQQRIERAGNKMVVVPTALGGTISSQEQTSSRLSRPASRPAAAQILNRSLINHPLPTNPAKPPKRPLEEEAGPIRQQTSSFVATSQQSDAKRRRTEDEKGDESFSRPTMSGAPIRRSNMGKKPSIFSQASYAPAPPPPHMTLPQAQMQQFPHQTVHQHVVYPSMSGKYGTGNKIPFGEAPNPPHFNGPTSVSALQQKHPQPIKSSPQYTNGDLIELPEIPSDSEDEVSVGDGKGFEVPDWASPTTLTEQLIRQETMDGDAVFGPIAPIKIEEVFAKGNKERLKRLRQRTSSANWTMSGDGLTLEEIKVDKEQRERMRLDGGWRYGL